MRQRSSASRTRRRARPSEARGRERWLLSYADFITLLFAFFTSLYAISVTDAAKAERLVRSMRESFGERPSDEATVMPSLVPQPGVIELMEPRATSRDGPSPQLQLLGERAAALAGEDGAPGIAVRHNEQGLVISLADSVLFGSGGAQLEPQARPVLQAVAELLNRVPNQVRVEGHTDSEPVGRRFASNWELSVARAVQVLHGLESAGVARHRLSAAGFADQRPLVSNRTPDGRRMNRRVDLVVLRGGLS